MTSPLGTRSAAGGAGVRRTLSEGSEALVAAVAIATCAAAPEFIWKGLKLVATHFSWATLISAILVALLLVFFVEPIIERVRDRLDDTSHSHRRAPHHLAITAMIGFFIALVTTGLHDAMGTFADISGAGGENAGLQRAITVTLSWGVVPFAIALAWQAATHRYLAIPLGIMAAASSFLAGWWFEWGVTTTLTTAIPCLAIQALGYRQVRAARADAVFARYAPTLAIVAIVWLAFAPAYDGLISLWHLGWPPLYGAPADYFIDARFYFGWFLGLLLTRLPADRTQFSGP